MGSPYLEPLRSKKKYAGYIEEGIDPDEAFLQELQSFPDAAITMGNISNAKPANHKEIIYTNESYLGEVVKILLIRCSDLPGKLDGLCIYYQQDGNGAQELYGAEFHD